MTILDKTRDILSKLLKNKGRYKSKHNLNCYGHAILNELGIGKALVIKARSRECTLTIFRV